MCVLCIGACGFLGEGSCESFSRTAGGPICPLARPVMAGQISGHHGPDRYPSAPTRAHTHTESPGAARSRGLTARHSRLSMGSAKGGEERPEGGARGLEVAVIAAKARLTAKRERKCVQIHQPSVKKPLNASLTCPSLYCCTSLFLHCKKYPTSTYIFRLL